MFEVTQVHQAVLPTRSQNSNVLICNYTCRHQKCFLPKAMPNKVAHNSKYRSTSWIHIRVSVSLFVLHDANKQGRIGWENRHY